jgi:hypothetical protein
MTDAPAGPSKPLVRLWDRAFKLIYSGEGDIGEVISQLTVTIDHADGTPRSGGRIAAVSLMEAGNPGQWIRSGGSGTTEAYPFVATPMYGGMCHGSYAGSLFELATIFMNAGVSVQYAQTMNESLITRARDSLAEDFLETECTHLMFIDSDIGFHAEDILTMLAADKDIVCGLYPRKEIDWIQVAAAARSGVAPDDLHQHTGALVVNTLNTPKKDAGDGLVEVANAGTGFMLIKRAVLEGLIDKVAAYQSGEKVLHEFFATSVDPDSGVGLSEDFHFCRLARDNGYQVWVALCVELTHTGSYMFTGR